MNHWGDSDVGVSLGRAFFIWSIVLVWGLVAMYFFGNVQNSGTAPAHTCAPGEVYTTRECS